MGRHPAAICCLLLALPLGIGGCGTASVEEEQTVVLESGNEADDVALSVVTRDTVDATESLSAVYRKYDEQEIYFPVSGKVIDKVYVEEGDEVKKGDLLVELAIGSLETDIAKLKYQIDRTEHQLAFLNEQEELDIRKINTEYAFRSWKDAESDKAIAKQIARLKRENNYTREEYNDALEFDRTKLAELQKEYDTSRVYAKFDGKVSKIKENLEGSTSNVEKCIMTIVDNSQGYFETKAGDLTAYLKPDQTYTVRILSGNGKGDYEVEPMNQGQWGETQSFRILSGDNADGLEAGNSGEMKVLTGRSENVLCLPSTCIHAAGDESYVYIRNDQGLREAVFVETGLSGGGVTEIVSGLEEGESVIGR